MKGAKEEIPGFKNVWNGETKEREKLVETATKNLYKLKCLKFNSLQLNTYRVSNQNISFAGQHKKKQCKDQREREKITTPQEEEEKKKKKNNNKKKKEKRRRKYG